MPWGDITVLPGGGGTFHDTTSCTRQLSDNWTLASLTFDITTVPCPFTVFDNSSLLQFSFLVRGPNSSFDFSGYGPYVNTDIEALRYDHTLSNLALINFVYFSTDPNNSGYQRAMPSSSSTPPGSAPYNYTGSFMLDSAYVEAWAVSKYELCKRNRDHAWAHHIRNRYGSWAVNNYCGHGIHMASATRMGYDWLHLPVER